MKHRATQRGVTLAELLVVVAISTVVILAAYEMMDGAVQASLFVEAHNDLPVFGQEVVNLFQRELMQSREFFPASAAGEAYRNALRTSGGVALTTLDAPDSLLPLADTGTQAVVPDTNAQRYVGNCILTARQLEPVLVPFDHDLNAGTPDVQFPADRYEFQYYYLSRDTRRNFSGVGYYLDLIQARSEIYADFFQLNSLSALQRANLAPKLRAAGVDLTKAWNPSSPVATAFFTVANNGTLPIINNPTIVITRIRSLLPAMAGGRISGYMNYSVAMCRTATKDCSTSTPPFRNIRTPLPLYAFGAAGTPAYPEGFEVKIVGPAGSRKVFVRLVLMAHYGVTKYDAAESISMTSVNF
jgi:prepilin-type N-terminal cleavage/methylation domain-containing protein